MLTLYLRKEEMIILSCSGATYSLGKTLLILLLGFLLGLKGSLLLCQSFFVKSLILVFQAITCVNDQVL